MYVEKDFAKNLQNTQVILWETLIFGLLYRTLKYKSQHSFWGRLLRVDSGELKETAKEKQT